MCSTIIDDGAVAKRQDDVVHHLLDELSLRELPEDQQVMNHEGREERHQKVEIAFRWNLAPLHGTFEHLLQPCRVRIDESLSKGEPELGVAGQRR